VEVGKNAGDSLWRTAVALMLDDVVCIQLWPAAKPTQTADLDTMAAKQAERFHG